MNDHLLAAMEGTVDAVFAEVREISEGRVTTYIPELAHVDPELFGLSICDLDGNLLNRGDVTQRFTLQSISKVLSYACVLEVCEEDLIDGHVGVEPTGEDFDSIIKLDRHKRPFNPMVNAGAIAVTDLLLSHFGKDALGETLAFYAKLFGRTSIEVDEAVFLSEQRTGERNRAIGHLLKNFDVLENPVEEVLALYFKHCAVRVTAADLARLGATLATRSRTGAFRKHNTARNVLSVMLTCGMYNYAGQWVYDVGYPAKSGVSGGVLGVVPDRIGIGVFSPKVDEKGSSPRGVQVNCLLSNKLNLHIFGHPE